ncbi:MAG: motif family protein [Ramlibacter sp.]|nr:motif family protein [Ramlibacter sp.]MDB5911547.1 motif family protein [Ramlibacter sp.]
MRGSLRKLAATVALVVGVVAPMLAHADLFRQTLVEGSSVLNVTRDSQSGLDWLDMRLTVSQTYDDVRTGIYYRMGFRHATKAQVQALFVHAGTPDDGFDTAVTWPMQTVALIDLLGETRTSFNSRHSLGFIGTDFLDNEITPETHRPGQVFSAQLGKVEYMDLRPTLPLLGEAHFTGGHPFSNEASPDWGSFLVRATNYTPCRTAGHSHNPKCHGQGHGQYK